MMLKIFVAVLITFVARFNVWALALGGSVGADLPLAQRGRTKPGVSAEGFYRLDPYEIRFHFGDTKATQYAVLGAVKHFFSSGVARPFVEGALGPVIVDYPLRSLAYGIRPEVSLGLDIGINESLSTGAIFRYYGLAYFGDTPSGKFEASHGFTLVGTIVVWF